MNDTTKIRAKQIKLLSSRNFFDATIVAAKKYPRSPANAGPFKSRRSAGVADISLARNSAMTMIWFRDLPRTRASFPPAPKQGRRSAEVADISLARNSAMTMIWFRDLPRTRAYFPPAPNKAAVRRRSRIFSTARNRSGGKFRDDNNLKLLSSRNFFDATIVGAKKYPRSPADAGLFKSRRSAGVADISLARNSAMTMVLAMVLAMVLTTGFFWE